MSHTGEDTMTGSRKRDASMTCGPLLEAATPDLFRSNPFRITGLPVDATAREITRHADKLKLMEELGSGEAVHSHAFALVPPPGVDQIRNAIHRLKDPERRIVDEFFWFWPARSGSSANDPAILALKAGDTEKALEIWMGLESSPTEGARAMHNIAVLWHMVALDWDDYADQEAMDSELTQRILQYWRDAFKRWELLATDDLLWAAVDSRVNELDDTRLGADFVGKMRATLPQALDKINAELAVRYAERGRMELAEVHVRFMRETNSGLDDVERTAELVLGRVSTRLKQQMQRAEERSVANRAETYEAVHELVVQAGQALALVRLFGGNQIRRADELSDDIAALGNRLQIACYKAISDDQVCLAILNLIRPLATAPDLQRRIDADIVGISAKALLDPLWQICETTVKKARENPASGEKLALHVLQEAPLWLAKLEGAGLSRDAINQAKNDVALTLMQCAVLHGNETQKWKPGIQILEKALQLAVGTDVKESILKNLETARSNDRLFGDLKPIKSAPSLSAVNGVGYILGRHSDYDLPTGSYLATHYFSMGGLPLCPLGRYRVSDAGGGGYRFYGRVPLRKGDRWHAGIFFSLIAWGLIYLITLKPELGSTHTSRRPEMPQVSYNPPKSFFPPPRSTLKPPFEPVKSGGEAVNGSGGGETQRENRSDRSALIIEKIEIEQERDVLDRRQNELEKLKQTIDSESLRLDRSKKLNVDAFNAKVDDYNSRIKSLKEANAAFNRKVDDYNRKLPNQYR